MALLCDALQKETMQCTCWGLLTLRCIPISFFQGEGARRYSHFQTVILKVSEQYSLKATPSLATIHGRD